MNFAPESARNLEKINDRNFMKIRISEAYPFPDV